MLCAVYIQDCEDVELDTPWLLEVAIVCFLGVNEPSLLLLRDCMSSESMHECHCLFIFWVLKEGNGGILTNHYLCWLHTSQWSSWFSIAWVLFHSGLKCLWSIITVWNHKKPVSLQIDRKSSSGFHWCHCTLVSLEHHDSLKAQETMGFWRLTDFGTADGCINSESGWVVLKFVFCKATRLDSISDRTSQHINHKPEKTKAKLQPPFYPGSHTMPPSTNQHSKLWIWPTFQ